MQNRNPIDNIIYQIETGKTLEAIEQLKGLSNDDDENQRLSMQSARYMDLMKEVHNGTTSTQESQLIRNQINSSLLHLTYTIAQHSSNVEYKNSANNILDLGHHKNLSSREKVVLFVGLSVIIGCCIVISYEWYTSTYYSSNTPSMLCSILLVFSIVTIMFNFSNFRN